jgi:hypothetical protein
LAARHVVKAAGSIPEVAPWLAFLQPELGRETRGEMLQDLYLRFPPRLAFLQPELGRETRGEMLQDLYLRLTRGFCFSSLNLAARHVVKCCRMYT